LSIPPGTPCIKKLGIPLEKFAVKYKIEISSVSKNNNNLLGFGLISKLKFALYSGKCYVGQSAPEVQLRFAWRLTSFLANNNSGA